MQHIAFGGCLAALLLVAPALAQQSAEKPSATVNEGQRVAGETPPPEKDSGESADRQKTPPADPLPPPTPVEREIDSEPACGPRCEAAQKREEADLVAQQRMADSTGDIVVVTEWQLYVGGVGIVLLIGTLWLTIKATNAAVEANKIARESSERQLRAYVGFGKIEIKWGADTRITTEVNFINHGTTPAYQVRYYANASVSNTEVDFSILPIEPSQTTADLAQHGRFNASLFTAPLGAEQVARAQKGELPAIFWGRLKYKDAFGEDRFVDYRYQWDARVGRLVAMSEGNKSN